MSHLKVLQSDLFYFLIRWRVLISSMVDLWHRLAVASDKLQGEEEEEDVEVEDTMEDTSEDSLGHLADHGYRDPAVQIVNINTNVFHQRNFSLV